AIGGLVAADVEPVQAVEALVVEADADRPIRGYGDPVEELVIGRVAIHAHRRAPGHPAVRGAAEADVGVGAVHPFRPAHVDVPVWADGNRVEAVDAEAV